MSETEYPGASSINFEDDKLSDKKSSPKRQLDGSFKWILPALSKAVESVETGMKSPISALNELNLRVSYSLGQSGPAHCPTFTVAVTVADMTFKGCGRRKREAKASAARTCLSALLARAGSNPEPEPDYTSDELPKYPAENYVDSQGIKPTSEVPIQCSQATCSDLNNCDKAELAENIERSYLHGASNDAPQQAVPPGNSIVTDNDEETKITNEMYRQLNRVCSDTAISYFNVVIDPNSFSRSVENIYHLSCLANDGRVAVFIDEDTGLPLIQTVSDEERRRSEEQNETESQFVVSIDMKLWKELIQAFEITEPFFKRQS